ncbi:MAG: integration host factor subunit alpha [Acidithiobacillus sp.]|nr:integration host factor subunit alpha [Acidithiobacillus sp.]
MTVTKQVVISHLTDTTGLTGKESRQVVELFFNTIRETLASGEELKLSGFGNFHIREKVVRPGRNSKDGTPFEIKARRVVTYSSSPILRRLCNEPERWGIYE